VALTNIRRRRTVAAARMAKMGFIVQGETLIGPGASTQAATRAVASLRKKVWMARS
jgi:hypothetical protein